MTIQLRRDTATNWASANPVLANGQPGFDTTNNIVKIGNGVSTWTALTAIGGGATNLSASYTSTTATVISDTGTDAVLAAADGTNAGVMTSAMQVKLAGIATGATANLGTVTTVSFATANGFSGSVANATTTPAITITLQDASGSQAGKLTASDWNTFNSKQAALVSGTNIKTVNGNSLLGSGDLVISAGGVTSGTSTVSFGVTETNEAQLVVTGQTGILAGSKVVASIGTTATADYTANDHKYLGSIGVSVTTGNVIAGTGFTIFVRSYQKMKGDISINWVY